MSIFTNWPRQVGLMLSKASSIKRGCYACQWLDNVEMHVHAKFDPNIPRGSRVMNTFTNWPRPVGLMLTKASSIKRGCYACQWLNNVEMHAYAKFDPNIPCGSRVMNTFTNWPRPVGLMLSKASSIKRGCYACQWLDSVEMHAYAKFDPNIPCGSRVMNTFTNWPRPVGLMLSKASSIKRGCYACQWLDSVEMHAYAKFDPNIPCGSRVMNIFTNWPRPVGLMLSKASSIKRGCYACQWLDSVDKHMCAKFDLNISCSSRVMSIFTTYSDYSVHLRVVQFSNYMYIMAHQNWNGRVYPCADPERRQGVRTPSEKSQL